jgi:fatty-acyl-CoA synthase
MASDNSYRREEGSRDYFYDWSIGQLLRDAVGRVPDRVALIAPAESEGAQVRSWTYRELLAEAERRAEALLGTCESGDRVATWAIGSADLLLLHLGAALAGIVLVTLNPASRVKELQYLLAHSQARALVLDRVYRKMDNVEVIENLLPSLPALRTLIYMDEWSSFVADAAGAKLPQVTHDAPALILFTSGTTGRPKAAVLRHDAVLNNARLTASCLGLTQGAVWLNLLPLFHIGGSATITLGCISNLGTQVLLPQFSGDAMIEAISDYGVNVTMAVPTMLTAMLASDKFAAAQLSSLEVIVVGGATVSPELVNVIKRRVGAEVMVLFGQTEAGGAMCMTRRGDDIKVVTGSVGAALPLSEVKVISPASGEIVPIAAIGEICVRTRCSMTEYLDMPEKTGEVVDKAGWLHTGDLGFMRSDGYLQVTGRLKDMIIRGGENIYPREIEDTLAEHSAILQSAVFGVPDEKWGEQIAVAIVLRTGCSADADALGSFLQRRIARHKVPKYWQFVDSLPVNASGKIQKFVLLDEFLAAARPQP